MSTALRMPDLVSPTRLFRHTVQSAIPSLLGLGVDLDQVVFAPAGAGWPDGTIVRQSPPPGAPLSPGARIELFVAGGGLLDCLPYAMREEDDRGFAADSLCRLFDSPAGKLRQHIASAGGYLALHPDEPRTALRWIRDIFQLEEALVPEEAWYGLALLLPALHRIGGRADGVPLAMRTVFGLPVKWCRISARIEPLPPEWQTLLGTRNGRLGVDAVVGEGTMTLSRLDLSYGPVDLGTYLKHTACDWEAARRRVLSLVLPAGVELGQEHWDVHPPEDGLVLGPASGGTLLGVNSRLGAGGKVAP